VLLLVALACGLGVTTWLVARPTPHVVSPPPVPSAPVAAAPRPSAEEASPAPTRPAVTPAARAEATALIGAAAQARGAGDLRAAVEDLQAAVERAPSVETHAALGALYLEMGVTASADLHLRAAAEGDPGNADRWIALANAYYLKPDPGAAAEALEQARTAEPGLRVTRDANGWLVRKPATPQP
jgi:Tfp pilus assembly protein PilF